MLLIERKIKGEKYKFLYFIIFRLIIVWVINVGFLKVIGNLRSFTEVLDKLQIIFCIFCLEFRLVAFGFDCIYKIFVFKRILN